MECFSEFSNQVYFKLLLYLDYIFQAPEIGKKGSRYREPVRAY